MWAALMTEAGEITWLDRALYKRTNKREDGRDVYEFWWRNVPRTIEPGLIQFVALYDAPEGGERLGLTRVLNRQPRVEKGNDISVTWGIDFGKQIGLRTFA